MNFAVQTNHKLKENDSKNLDEYLGLARELKKKLGYEYDSNTNKS